MRAWLKVFLVFLATAVVALAQVNPGAASPTFGGGGGTPSFVTYKRGGGTTNQSLQVWMDATRVMPEAFGAKGDGTTDDTTAIQAADAYASTGSTIYLSQNVLYFTPGKTYYHATGLTLSSNIMGIGAYLTSPQDFTGTAVTYGVAGSITYNKFCWFPFVRCTKTNYNNWYANPNSTGIQILNCQTSEFHFEGAANWANGIWVAAQGRGCSENQYFPGLLLDNQKSMRFEPLDSIGYINDSNVWGGKTSLSGGDGTNNPFCYSVYIKDYATPAATTTGANQSIALTLSPNVFTWGAGNFTTANFYVGQNVIVTGLTGTASNNATYRVTAVGTTTLTVAANSVGAGGATLVADPSSTTVQIVGEGSTFGSLPNMVNFYGSDLEGNAQEAFVCIKGGTMNAFYGCRFETSGTPTMMFLGMGALAPSTYNNVYGGYVSSGLDFTVITGSAATSYGNTDMHGDRLAHSSLNALGWLQLANNAANTNPVLGIWPTAGGDASLWKPAGTTWTGQLGSAYWDSKPTGVTYPTVRVSSNGSNILFGDGTATPVSAIKSASLNNLDFLPQGNEALKLTGVTTQVDYLNVTGAATANPATITIAAAGSDSNVNIKLVPLGTGKLLDGAGLAITSGSSAAGVKTSAAPTGTASTTAVMGGLSFTLTPTQTGRVLFICSGQMANSTINDGVTVDLRYGTGGAPANGAAVSGTLVGIAQTSTSLVAASKSGFCISGVITGLTVGTAYWFDFSQLAVTAGTATVTGVSASVVEE